MKTATHSQQRQSLKQGLELPKYMQTLIKDNFIQAHGNRNEFGDHYLNLKALALHFDTKHIWKAKLIFYPEEYALLIEFVTTQAYRALGGKEDIWSHVYEIPEDVTGFKDVLYLTYLKEFPSVYEKDYKPTSRLVIIEKH